MLKVEGMSCQHCKKKVETALKDLGLKCVKVDIETGEVSYRNHKEITTEQVKQTIRDLGYQV